MTGEEIMKGEEETVLEGMMWGNSDDCRELSCSEYETRRGPGDSLFIPKGW